jgi:hypothetical protein
MDACKPIQFYTPAQTAAGIIGILAMWAAMIALCFI